MLVSQKSASSGFSWQGGSSPSQGSTRLRSSHDRNMSQDILRATGHRCGVPLRFRLRAERRRDSSGNGEPHQRSSGPERSPSYPLDSADSTNTLYDEAISRRTTASLEE